jgi:hypothetical protein
MTRPVSARAADTAAVRAIAQACVNVELFTIPLYLVAATSIAGMHQITGKDNDFYQGRLWPGAAPVASPQSPNETAYNTMFAIIIEEMLHLQLAANIASAVGGTPLFTSPALQDDQHGWTCYGNFATKTGSSFIPHIVDLADTVHAGTTVTTDSLTAEQLELFLIIEESEVTSRSHITNPEKYFPSVPFDGWTASMTEVDLPMFGTIGWMYECYYQYLTLTYDDGSTLWNTIFVPESQQRDIFSIKTAGHPADEYPGFRTLINTDKPAKALNQVLEMMNAITDQGEGSVLDERTLDTPEVVKQYQSVPAALEADYPYFSDTGAPVESADAVARTVSSKTDHYQLFSNLLAMAERIELWPAWHATNGPWTAALLQTPDAAPTIYNIPSAAAVADALNRIASAPEAMRPLFSQAATGSLAGITTTLNQYWRNPDVMFPYPAMTGVGDRMALSWVLFGLPPDLALGVTPADVSAAQHACQGLNLTDPGNACAEIGVYHSCQGSNNCANQGGCGFVQKIGEAQPNASCGFALVAAKAADKTGGYFSAPSGNICAGYGGCAVPISAAQLLVQGGTMALYEDGEQVEEMTFSKVASVHETAMRAADLDEELPSDVRLVFPPST